MATYYKRTNPLLGSASTTRYLTIPTTPATVVQLTSGYQALTLFNVGSATCIWGDSNIAVNSGNFLFVQSRVEWLTVQDTWQVYLRAESVATLIAVTEYAV